MQSSSSTIISESRSKSNLGNVESSSLEGEPALPTHHTPKQDVSSIANLSLETNIVASDDLVSEIIAEEDDDWLMSDEDIQTSTASPSEETQKLQIAHQGEDASAVTRVKSMADRDWEKVEAQFKDVSHLARDQFRRAARRLWPTSTQDGMKRPFLMFCSIRTEIRSQKNCFSLTSISINQLCSRLQSFPTSLLPLPLNRQATAKVSLLESSRLFKQGLTLASTL